MKLSQNAKEWIKDIGLAVVAAMIILFFIQPTIVREHSMENTLVENDYLFVSKQTYKLLGKDPARGDIIVFESDIPALGGGSKLLIKRIIGVPGDTVSIHNDYVYINGEKIEETYTKDGYTATELDPVEVPEGYLFVMGDNRQNSSDSRDPRIGLVSMDSVMGKAVLRLFPFSKFGGLYK
jgi:signal peptidase I